MDREEELLASCCNHVNIESCCWKVHPTQADTVVVFVAVDDHPCGAVSLRGSATDIGGGMFKIEVKVKESANIVLGEKNYEKIDVFHGGTVDSVYVTKNTACTPAQIGTNQDPGYTAC